MEIKTVEKGAELVSVIFNGEERLHDGKTFWGKHSPVLFPTIGNLRYPTVIIEGKEYIPSLEELFETIKKHIKYQLENDNEKQANLKLRKQIAWYLKGLKDSSRIRDEINKSDNIENTLKILDEYYNRLKVEVN